MYQLQGYAGNNFRRARKQGRALGIHQYANAAGMSCAMVVYMEAVESDLMRMSASGASTRSLAASLRLQRMPRVLLRNIAVRTLDTTTIISNKEPET